MATGPSMEGTARQVVASGAPAFLPRAVKSVELQAARVADRWAPEGATSALQPGLRNLAFVDRMLVSRPAAQTAATGTAATPTSARQGLATGGPASFLFPVPWYLDAAASPVEAVRRAVHTALPAQAPSWLVAAQATPMRRSVTRR